MGDLASSVVGAVLDAVFSRASRKPVFVAHLLIATYIVTSPRLTFLHQTEVRYLGIALVFMVITYGFLKWWVGEQFVEELLRALKPLFENYPDSIFEKSEKNSESERSSAGGMIIVVLVLIPLLVFVRLLIMIFSLLFVDLMLGEVAGTTFSAVLSESFEARVIILAGAFGLALLTPGVLGAGNGGVKNSESRSTEVVEGTLADYVKNVFGPPANFLLRFVARLIDPSLDEKNLPIHFDVRRIDVKSYRHISNNLYCLVSGNVKRRECENRVTGGFALHPLNNGCRDPLSNVISLTPPPLSKICWFEVTRDGRLVGYLGTLNHASTRILLVLLGRPEIEMLKILVFR